ncbi:MAG: glycosyltransferase 87 family protein [Specibacter sp.]
MQDSQASGRQFPQHIVVPSRSDPLLKTMAEPIGGPLGRRTDPGRTDPGFFTVERVLVFMAAVSAIIAVAAKSHCRQLGWTTPDQYSTVCWSAIPNSFVADKLGSVFPFLSHGATFDFPPLAGLIAGVTAWLTGSAGNGAPRQLAFFDVNAALIAVVWIFTVVVVARTARRRPWDAAIVAASPLLWLTAYVSWDFWAAALVALAIYLFSRRRSIWAGFVLGLAAMVAPYAILLVLVLVFLGIRSGKTTQMLESLAAAAVGWLLVLAPAMAFNSSAWGAWVGPLFSQPASESSIYGGYNIVAERMGLPQLSGSSVNILTAVLLGLLVLGVGTLALYAPRRPRVAQLSAVAVAGFMVVNKSTEPWHAIWLLPLLALALPRWRPVLLWQAAIVTHFIALMLYQSKVLGNISAQHAIDAPYFVLASLLGGIATCALIGLLVRDIRHPKHDVVRRHGVDDPQGGVLLDVAEPADVVVAGSASGTETASGHPRHG